VSEIPQALLEKLSQDLRPVRAVLPARVRSAIVILLGAFAAIVLLMRFGVRDDIAAQDTMRFSAFLLVRIAAGVTLIALALREAIPSAAAPDRVRSSALLIGLVLLVLLPLFFATGDAPLAPMQCGVLILAVSALPFVALMILIYRAYPLRPVVTGLTAGLGSGLLAEAALFAMCSNAGAMHGTVVHGSAVAIMGVIGAIIGYVTKRRSPAY
jgi:hypothetical protein